MPLKRKKETNKQIHQLTNDIDKLKQDLTNVSDVNRLEIIKESLNEKICELESIIENKINGFILRSKANVIEHNEKNSKYFASLENKKSESKLRSRLTINNQTTTDQTEILKATEDFYKNLYKTKESKNSAYNFFDDTMKKLNEIEKESCDGLLTGNRM